MQFVDGEEQAACTEDLTVRVVFPGGQLNAHRREHARHQVMHKVAARAALHENAGKIRADVVVHEFFARRVHERLAKRKAHPVAVFIVRAFAAH